MKTIIFVILLASALMLSCSRSLSPTVSFSGKTMGTIYNVKYVNQANAEAKLSPQEMQKEIDVLLADINQLMSTYIPDSELSLLNQVDAGISFSISPKTEYVLREAIRIHNLSEGMLDITVGPLVNLWGFGPNAQADVVPTEEALNETMQYVGIDKFTLSDSIVNKRHNKVYIDLSTIAKGYGVDAIAEFLELQGVSNYLVDIGGEMRVAGKKINNEEWLIAIEKPIVGQRSVQKILSIGDNAIATSGDYRNYFEEDGVRYSHLINPKTGFPIQHNLVSVSVVAPKAITADGLATALIVLGAEDGIKWAEKDNIAALFITKVGEQFVEYETQAFKQIVDVKQSN